MTFRSVTTCALAGGLLTGTALCATAQTSVAQSAVTTMAVKPGVTLNLRSGPGTNYASQGSIGGGSTVTGTVQNGWFKITRGAHAGSWVSAAYLTNSSAPTAGKPTSTGAFHGYIVKTLIKTVAHKTPSSGGVFSRYLSPGVAISGTIQGDWLKTSSGDYVSRALITTAPLSNGALPGSRLCNIPIAWNTKESIPFYTASTARRLDCFALKGLTGLENAYRAKFGHFAAIDLAYRPLREQRYWFDKYGYPRAAVPGTSNHGLGVAVDFHETDKKGEEFGWGGYGYTWLKSNGWKWGYRNTFPYGQWGESYHWDFEGVNVYKK